jgi:flagellar hook-associated protein 3 FlgL
MRVTNQTIIRSSTRRLQDNLQAVERLRRDIETTRKLHAISDDPTAGGELVRLGSSMRAIEQFRRNIRLGDARANAEENVLDQLTSTLSRGIDLATTQSSSTATAQTRLIAKAEVDQLLDYAVSLGNTKFGDDYLFGGTRAGEAPLRNVAAPGSFSALVDTTNTTVNPSGSIDLEIGDGKFVTPNHNATEIFLDTGALAALRDLSTALGNNDVPGIQAATTALTTASSNVQTLIGQQGARGAEFRTATDSLGALEITLKTFQSDLRDTDMESAMVQFVGKQTQYQAAMAATARVLGLSLANYI